MKYVLQKIEWSDYVPLHKKEFDLLKLAAEKGYLGEVDIEEEEYGYIGVQKKFWSLAVTLLDPETKNNPLKRRTFIRKRKREFKVIDKQRERRNQIKKDRYKKQRQIFKDNIQKIKRKKFL